MRENRKSFSTALPLAFLEKITLYQYRNYEDYTRCFSQRLVCISGRNGTGKTNLMDAIYLLCYTKSYFTHLHQALIKDGCDGFRVAGDFRRPGRDVDNVTCVFRNGKKELSHNEVFYERQSEHIGHFTAVMISPDDLSLVNDGSEERRKWIDALLSQTDRSYLDALLRYHKVLQSRNAWLRQQNTAKPQDVQLEYYDAQLATAGDYIGAQRRILLQRILPEVQMQYQRLCSDAEVINWNYKTDLDHNHTQAILHQSMEHDFRVQRTTRGIHRDDLELLINDKPAKGYASQGQKKSLLFAMKLAQYFFVRKTTGDTPILLLDDVFEKLDAGRVQALMDIICHKEVGQVFITDTDKGRVVKLFGREERMDVVEFLST